MLLFVGLGNPGKAYAGNRHNIGFMALDEIARSANFPPFRARFQGLATEGAIGAQRVILLKPTTYMNESGDAVRRLVHRYGVAPEQVIVVHDELDLPLAALKLKAGGGLAGHNGLRSIKSHLHDDTFLRVRIGIGKPPSRERGADHVLDRFSKRDRTEIDVTLAQAADAVETIVADGIDAAMNRYN